LGIVCDVHIENRIGDRTRRVDGPGCDVVLPLVSASAFQPDLRELGFRGRLRGMNLNIKLLAGRNARCALIRGSPTESSALCIGFIATEGDQIQAQRVAERGLELIDLGIKFEQ
jgi:hypothetical protein